MSIVEFNGPPSWSLDASETGESTKCPSVVAVGLIGSLMDVHVRYNSWNISMPSSATQQREMIKFCFVWRT